MTPLPDDLAKNSHIVSVEVGAVPNYLSPQFKGLLEADLRSSVSDCAKGSRPLQLEADVTSFKWQDPVVTYIARDSDAITGEVKLIDPETHQTVGHYVIHHELAVSGLLGAIVLSPYESKMAGGFADAVCRVVFAR
jgi:hypothetical protein